MVVIIPARRIRWTGTCRIVSTRFPPIPLFEDVAEPSELESVYAIEALTNPRLRQEAGELDLVPPADRLSGPGSSIIMAAFTHRNRQGSRFSDGTYGVYYAGRKLETAIRETVFHTERFLRFSNEAEIDVDRRVHYADLEGTLHDIRGGHADLHDPDSYAASQATARTLRAEDSHGIVYDSVRHPGGQCVAAFRPTVLTPTVQGPYLSYHWDGTRITHYYTKGQAVRLRSGGR